MISKIYDENILVNAVGKNYDIFSEKIRSLYKAYGFKYPFCEFYVQEKGTVIASYYGSAVISDKTGSDTEELSAFINENIFGEILMPESFFEQVRPDKGHYDINNCLIMTSDDCNENVSVISNFNKEALDTEPAIGEVYEIARDGFDIDFIPWYTDTSHNIRHGISGLYIYKNSSCAVKMFSSNGISFFSYICTKKNERGKGIASEMLRAIIKKEHIEGNRVCLICEPGLERFYRAAGFLKNGYAIEIKRVK